MVRWRQVSALLKPVITYGIHLLEIVLESTNHWPEG